MKYSSKFETTTRAAQDDLTAFSVSLRDAASFLLNSNAAEISLETAQRLQEIAAALNPIIAGSSSDRITKRNSVFDTVRHLIEGKAQPAPAIQPRPQTASFFAEKFSCVAQLNAEIDQALVYLRLSPSAEAQPHIRNLTAAREDTMLLVKAETRLSSKNQIALVG